MSVTIEMPPEVIGTLASDADCARRRALLELAVALYRDGQLPPGQAASLAGLGRWEFERVLVEREVPLPYTRDMLIEDARHAGYRL